MKLIVNKKESSVLNEFLDREWEIANIKRFGKDEWVEKEGNIIAEDNGEIIGYLRYHYRGGVMEILSNCCSSEAATRYWYSSYGKSRRNDAS